MDKNGFPGKFTRLIKTMIDSDNALCKYRVQYRGRLKHSKGFAKLLTFLPSVLHCAIRYYETGGLKRAVHDLQ